MKKEKKGQSYTFNDTGFEEVPKNEATPPKLGKYDLFGNVLEDLDNLMKSLNIQDKGVGENVDKTTSKTLLEILNFDANDPKIIEEIVDSNFRHYKIDLLKKKADPCAMSLNGFDNALIGVTYDGRLVYDKDIMYKIILGTMDCDSKDVRIDADEYLATIMSDDYGRLSPIFMSLNIDLVLSTLK